MRRFCWRERSEQLNWRLLGALDVDDAVRRGDPALLEPYALHVTFARLPNAPKDPTTRDAWFLLRVLQLSMEYLLYMRARDGDVLDSLSREMRQLETARDELLLREHKWKARTRSGEKQVEKLHQVLQNIAKLLQIHGASPSAVATIETLLTELISGRRARQRKKTLMKKGDEEMDEVQEARACGFCGKLFSSAEYLEKHLVRRHAGESLEVETLVKHKMKRDFEREGEDKENKMKNEDAAASEVAMQKMVQQVERALHDHEEKLRSLAEEEATKVQQMYERLHAETKLARELNLSRNKTEDEHKVSQRQMDEVCQQKQKAEDELEDLKQQIQFLTLKGNMMRSAGLPASSPSRDDNALVAAETEIRNLQQTLEVVNRELAASREELAKVQALHLSALRKKKELVDKLASTREDSSVVLRENSTQTEQRATVDGGVQTDYDQISSSLIENETLTEPYAPACADVGTDALVLSYEDMGIQTVELLQAPALFDAEVQAVIEDDPIPTTIAAVRHEGPGLTSQEPPLNDTGSLMEEIVPPHPTAQKKDDQISDYIQQIHSQDLLDTLAERAQSAASKAVTTEAQQNPIARDYSSIPRHKYVRSRFHHDEDVVKERVSSCLSQLEQFSRRFGVPAKSAWLSDENLQIIQQALHGHLEVLPTEVLAKMVGSENAVNAIIEKEWMPMEKTRQQALERFKMEARAKSEVSQGLVRQAMAAFGASMKPNQPSGASNSDGVVATNTGRSASPGEISTNRDNKYNENENQELPMDNEDNPGVSLMAPTRRYSAKNTLTVVVEGENLREGTAYLAEDFAESNTADIQGASSSEAQEALDYLVESPHRDDETSKLEEHRPDVTTIASNVSNLQASRDIPVTRQPPLGESKPVAANTSAEHSEDPQTRLPRESSANSIRSIKVDAVTDDRRRPSWETEPLLRSRSGDHSGLEPTSIEVQRVGAGLEHTEDSRQAEWQDEVPEEDSQWHLPRVGSSTDLGPPQARSSVHPALSRTGSDRFEAANSPQRTNSLESDQLSIASEFELIQPMARLDRTQSIVASSEMFFDADIPSLGVESESVEASTSAVVMGLVDLVDRSAEAGNHEDSSPSALHTPVRVVANDDQNDSVMSFDDSDIEEVVLT